MPKLAELMESIHKEYEKRRAQLDRDFADMDAAFQKWKEGVLKFEHTEYSSDDDPVSDDRLCDGECVWPGEDESNLQRDAQEADGESEDNYGPEERREDDQ